MAESTSLCSVPNAERLAATTGPRSITIRTGLLAGALFLGAALTVVQMLPQAIWRGGLPDLVVVGGALWFNARWFPAGPLCWPNIFLVILTLFHLGYYVVVANGLTAPLPFMPDLQHAADINLALQLFATSCLAFEGGAIAYLAIGRPSQSLSTRDHRRAERIFFKLGVAVTAASFGLFVVYIDQLGGLSAIARVDYTKYITFLQSHDPRFAALSIDYLPAGLLLMYAFLDKDSRQHRKRVIAIILPFMGFTLWLLWVGDRGAALLYWLALAYVHNLRGGRISGRKLALMASVILLLVGPVRAIRNLTPSARVRGLATASYNPVNGVSEMGLTFRPYLALIQQRANGTSLGSKPYVSALAHVVPNIGSLNSQNRPFRTTLYVSYLVDPVSAAAGIGLGGSAIGEPFLAFGLVGLVTVCAALGCLVAVLECRAAHGRSPATLALIPLVFYPLNFYVRDDIYGVTRPVIWGCIAVGAVKLILWWSSREAGHA